MTVRFQWDESYSINGGVIDAEHQRLFELANQAFAVADPNRQADLFKQIVQDFYDYMRYHFNNEEQLMRRVGYPDLQNHVTKHEEIVGQMNRALTDSVDMAELAHAVRHIAVDWIATHILAEDKKIGRFIEQASTQPA